MSKQRIVVALGGNALGNSPEEQLELVKNTAKSLVDMIEQGHEIIIVHGNGPQVGMINLAMDHASKSIGTSEMPFPECGAMSQGYIGYHLQNSIGTELKKREINKKVATVVTQVVVDRNDPAFQNPTKPIGAFMDKAEADELAKKGINVVEDAGRGYRRVVPSPKPSRIEEIDIIKALVNNGTVVIACGGGGIPVVEEENYLIGVPSVIDKDFASEKLAENLDADYLVILTAVEKVAINFGKPDEKWLAELSPEEALTYALEGHFAPGSMLPKVEACIKFANSKTGRRALITSLEKAEEGIKGLTGTVITRAEKE